MSATRRPIEDFLWSILVLGGLLIASVFVMWPRETRVDFRKTAPKGAEKATIATQDVSPAAATAPSTSDAATNAATTTSNAVSRSGVADSSSSTTEIASGTPPAPESPTTKPATSNGGTADSHANMQRAMQAVDDGNWQEAETLLKSVLATDPQNEAALSEMAMIYLIDKKDPEAAMPYLHDALEANPQNETMMTEYVNAAKLTGKLPEAIEYLQSIEGKGGQVDLGIARAYQAVGDSEQAIPYFEKSVREGSGGVPSEETLEDLSDAYAGIGNNVKANEALQNAIISAEQTAAQHGGDPAAKENLSYLKIKQATLLWDMGDFAKSKALIAEIERNDPNNELLLALKKDMEQGQTATAP